MLKISTEQFVKIWLEAKLQNQNASWVAKQLGVSRQAVMKRAGRLRSRGRDLPDLLTHIEGDDARADELLRRAKA